MACKPAWHTASRQKNKARHACFPFAEPQLENNALQRIAYCLPLLGLQSNPANNCKPVWSSKYRAEIKCVAERTNHSMTVRIPDLEGGAGSRRAHYLSCNCTARCERFLCDHNISCVVICLGMFKGRRLHPLAVWFSTAGHCVSGNDTAHSPFANSDSQQVSFAVCSACNCCI